MAHKDEIAAFTDKTTHVTEHIRLLGVLFVVCYEEKPIDITSEHMYADKKRHKRTVFTTSRQAQRLADRLNKRYKTDSFSVQQLTPNGTIQENTNADIG